MTTECPEWCRYAGTDHAAHMSQSVQVDGCFAGLMLAFTFNGNEWVQTPHVTIGHFDATASTFTVEIGEDSLRLATFLEALGHDDLAQTIRDLNERQAEPEIAYRDLEVGDPE